jgi:hypothetical protein
VGSARRSTTTRHDTGQALSRPGPSVGVREPASRRLLLCLSFERRFLGDVNEGLAVGLGSHRLLLA